MLRMKNLRIAPGPLTDQFMAQEKHGLWVRPSSLYCRHTALTNHRHKNNELIQRALEAEHK